LAASLAATGGQNPSSTYTCHGEGYLTIWCVVMKLVHLKFGYNILEPQTTIYKWMFQLDDSKSLHRKWLFHQTSIYKWLFGVPGSQQEIQVTHVF